MGCVEIEEGVAWACACAREGERVGAEEERE